LFIPARSWVESIILAYRPAPAKHREPHAMTVHRPFSGVDQQRGVGAVSGDRRDIRRPFRRCREAAHDARTDVFGEYGGQNL
jgi:hypothetical protein